MLEIIANHFISILIAIAGYGGVYILKSISDDMRALKADYKKLLYAKVADKAGLEKNIQEIKELLQGQYMTKQDFNTKINELKNELKAEIKKGEYYAGKQTRH